MMQYSHRGEINPSPSLFDSLMAFTQPMIEHTPVHYPHFSELSLNGRTEHCQWLLAPVLRDLSASVQERWLTLIAPPEHITHSWLKEIGLNRERIILLHQVEQNNAMALACRALSAGCSHTVVSWLNRMDNRTRQQLDRAAASGRSQSLNIQLSC